MFLKKSSAQEFAQELENNLHNNEFAEEKEIFAKLVQAADLLDSLGYQNSADQITSIMQKVVQASSEAKSDPAIRGLSSEKMVSNLKQKGWVFNAKDGQEKKQEKDDIEVEEEESVTAIE